MKCQGCGIDDRVKACELVNGSSMNLCPPCRRKHDELIAAVAIDGAEDRRSEEADALDWSREQMRDMSGGIIGHGGLK